MKNYYLVRGDVTAIAVRRKNGDVLEVLIDTSDLERMGEFAGTWVSAWYKDVQNYRIFGHLHLGINKYAEVLLYRYLLDAPDGLDVDHINHNTLDNRRSNLRLVTKSQNMQNRRGASVVSSSGIRGVGMYPKRWAKPWKAFVMVDGKGIHRRFNTKEEAAAAALEMRKQYLPFSLDAHDTQEPPQIGPVFTSEHLRVLNQMPRSPLDVDVLRSLSTFFEPKRPTTIGMATGRYTTDQNVQSLAKPPLRRLVKDGLAERIDNGPQNVFYLATSKGRKVIADFDASEWSDRLFREESSA